MLDAINQNPLLSSIISAIITFLLTLTGSYIIQRWQNKKDIEKSLKKELSKAKEKLAKYESIPEQEKNIEKFDGRSIYIEKLPDGKERKICGYCWENDRKKIPIIGEYQENEDHGGYIARCSCCNRTCVGASYSFVESAPTKSNDDDLPF